MTETQDSSVNKKKKAAKRNGKAKVAVHPFDHLTDAEKIFAEKVFLERESLVDAFKEMDFHKYDRDYNTFGNPVKKGDSMTDATISLKSKEKYDKVCEYGNHLLAEQHERLEKNANYSRDVAIQTCLVNIKTSRKMISKYSDALDKISSYDAEGLRDVSTALTQAQKTLLVFLQELNRLEKLHDRDDVDNLDKVTIIIKEDLDR